MSTCLVLHLILKCQHVLQIAKMKKIADKVLIILIIGKFSVFSWITFIKLDNCIKINIYLINNH